MMSIPPVAFTYQARYLSNYDGDSVTLLVDLGYHVRAEVTARLLGLNCPELVDPSGAGKLAQIFTAHWLTSSRAALLERRLDLWPLVVQSVKALEPSTEKYGRFLLTVWRKSDGRELNQDLIESGHAVLWDGKGQRPS